MIAVKAAVASAVYATLDFWCLALALSPFVVPPLLAFASAALAVVRGRVARTLGARC